MLSELLTRERLAAHLPAPGRWRPVPPVDDRAFWDGVDAATRTALLDHADALAAGPWPELTGSLWLDFARTGNRVRYETSFLARRRRLAAAVLAACLADDQRWHDEVIDGAWLLAAEWTWCLPAHDESNGRRNLLAVPRAEEPTLDLFAAETGALLAWLLAVLRTRLAERAPGLAERLTEEVGRRMLVPQRTVDSWVWFGRRGRVNNWNPWINSNVLATSLLLDHDHEDILRTTERAVEGLDVFLAGYPADGACDEGQLYWWRAGASLSECLEILRLAGGAELDGYGLPLVAEIARYPHRVHIADDWYVNVADGPAKLDPDVTVAHLMHRFGRRIHDQQLVDHGRAMRGAGPVVEPGAGLGRSLLALADHDWRDAPPAEPPLIDQAWWPDTQLLTARQSAGERAGLFLSAKGGHNGEDHNHNDVGTVLVALDGHPVLVDAGVDEYSQQHFSPQRYELWTLRSAFHNVPLTDGHEQSPGRDHAARDVGCTLADDQVIFEADLAGAYPAEAGLRGWRRSAELDRAGDGRVTLTDRWEFDHDPAEVRLTLMFSGYPEPVEPGLLQVRTPTRPLAVRFDAEALEVLTEVIDLTSRRLQWVWGDRLWRTTLIIRTPAATGRCAVTFEPQNSPSCQN
ncbi:heparinase II/III domain-containing protein [Microlunatus speluncae]|uniref:heparinase II/III domain-containing protein n=1 Tax=Microlunatus speluncae TaxID=2594267 RepID=UPI0012666CE2|nr:heparinase II/III family protein [Microlunatus speluncae]